MSQIILGVDIGATTIKAGRVSPDGQVSHKSQVPVSAASNAAFLNQLTLLVKEHEASIQSVGVGSPAPLDISSGVIIASANMPQISHCGVLDHLKNQFPNIHFKLENDANCATLGEKFFGLGKNMDHFGLLTLGTGIGGGLIFDGKLQRGYQGNFFEIGHSPIFGASQFPLLCGCGNLGCLETISSATGVAHSFARSSGSSNKITALEIAQLARKNNPHAQSAYREAAVGLGLALAVVTQLTNTTQFIITGGMAAADDLLYAPLLQTWQSHTLALFHPLCKIQFTQGDENAGILGAAALFLES